MTDELTKAEKLARAMHNFMSGGRVLRRQLAAQTRDELRRLDAETARLRRERDEARDKALVEARQAVAAESSGHHEGAAGDEALRCACMAIEALRTAPPPTEAPESEIARLRRERDEARDKALVEAGVELEANWPHKATPEMRDAILALRTAPPPAEAPKAKTLAEAAEVLWNAMPNPLFDTLKYALIGEHHVKFETYEYDEDLEEEVAVHHKYAVDWDLQKTIIRDVLNALRTGASS